VYYVKMTKLALKVGENNCDSPCLSDSLCFDYGLEQVATLSIFFFSFYRLLSLNILQGFLFCFENVAFTEIG